MYIRFWFRDTQNHSRTETLDVQKVTHSATVAFGNSCHRSHTHEDEMCPVSSRWRPTPRWRSSLGDNATSADRSSAKPAQTANGELQRTSVPQSAHATTSPSTGRRYHVQRMSAVCLPLIFICVSRKVDVAVVRVWYCTVNGVCVFCTYAFRSFFISNRVCDWGFDR